LRLSSSREAFPPIKANEVRPFILVVSTFRKKPSLRRSKCSGRWSCNEIENNFFVLHLDELCCLKPAEVPSGTAAYPATDACPMSE
jgi:hypothetical protein